MGRSPLLGDESAEQGKVPVSTNPSTCMRAALSPSLSLSLPLSLACLLAGRLELWGDAPAPPCATALPLSLSLCLACLLACLLACSLCFALGLGYEQSSQPAQPCNPIHHFVGWALLYRGLEV